jgi:hypothetical protein
VERPGRDFEIIRDSGATSIVVPSSQVRNFVERYFCNLKQFRRTATRFNKLAHNFLAAVALASARLWLLAIKSTH